MDSLDIVHELKKRGKSQSQLARDLDMSISVVNSVIHGKVTSHTVAQHISNILGKEINDLWPNQYVFKPRKTKRSVQLARQQKGKESQK